MKAFSLTALMPGLGKLQQLGLEQFGFLGHLSLFLWFLHVVSGRITAEFLKGGQDLPQ